MVGNAATFHQIDSLDAYVDDLIAQNGGVYTVANGSAHVAVYAAAAAGAVWAWGAAGGGQFGIGLQSGASRLAGIPLPHVTFGYGSGGNLVWAHGFGAGGPVATTFATEGAVSLTGIPILAPSAISAWLATCPNSRTCAHAALEAFLRGMYIRR